MAATELAEMLRKYPNEEKKKKGFRDTEEMVATFSQTVAVLV